MSRLVVVSNRVAPISEGKPAAGGLAVAIDDALRETGGMWFGWSGSHSSDGKAALRLTHSGKIHIATIDIPKRDYEDYYRGYANSTLWPLCHYRPDLLQQHVRYFAGYLRVNLLFAKALAELIKPDDLLWVHDYHLIPLAQELRKLGVRNRIGFFLHIPFPPFDLFRACTDYHALMRAFASYDVVGLQTENDVENFVSTLRRAAGPLTENNGYIRVLDRFLQVQAFPIGIAPDALQRIAEKSVGSATTLDLVQSLNGRPLMVGVDRLDYSKGLDQRFLAYERFLAARTDKDPRVTFLQIAPPSRTEVATYRQIRRQLETLTGHINGRFADIDWVPLRYLNRSIGRTELMGIFRSARACIVTPFRDGMNLVAKEYVAAQDPEAPGALILSRFAGAASELDAAVLVNPYDPQTVADGISRALAMPMEERRLRWLHMMSVLRRNSITRWRDTFIAALKGNTALVAVS